jgi:hypothetical protein
MMAYKQNPSTATTPPLYPYNPAQGSVSAYPISQQTDETMRSPKSAHFDFANEEKRRTMTSSRSSPFSDTNEVKTLTMLNFSFRNTHIHHGVAEAGASVIRVQSPAPPLVPPKDGITVQRTIQIQEDDYDETPEGFLRSGVESNGIGSASSWPGIRDGTSASEYHIGRKDSMTIIREDGIIPRGELGAWDEG